MIQIESIFQSAKRAGACKAWRNIKAWEGIRSKEDLCRMFRDDYDWTTFCMAYNFPRLHVLRSEFRDVADKYGIYIDRRDVHLNNPVFAVFYGNSEGKITIDSVEKFQNIYVRDNSNVNMICDGYSACNITLMGKSRAKIIQRGNAAVNLYAYQGAVYSCEGEVSTRVYDQQEMKIIGE